MAETARTRARRANVGDGARSHLPDADYADAFTVSCVVAEPATLTAARWVHAAVDDIAVPLRRFVRGAQRGVLGLRLAHRTAAGTIEGWTVLDDSPNRMILGADGPLLMARLVVERTGASATITTLVRYRRGGARPLWAAVGIAHRQVAAYLLNHAAGVLSDRRPSAR